MSSSNPSACINCNIQSSTSNYANTQTNITVKINPPPKRYNPGILATSSGAGTSDVVNKAIQVSAQSGQASGDAQQKKDRSSAQTANILSKILNVESDIVQSDVAKRRIQDSSANRQQVVEEQKKDTKKILIVEGRVRRKAEAVIDTVKMDKGDKNMKKNKRYRTVGTVLASAPQYKAKFNALLREKPKIKLPDELQKEIDAIPKSFDGRVVWKEFIRPVRTQGLCGSCWAFSALFCLQSRLSIYSKGKYNYDLSPAKMVYCSISIPQNAKSELDSIKNMLLKGQRYDYKNTENRDQNESYGCGGETLINTWQFLYRVGVPEESCILYGDEETDPKKLKLNLTQTEDISMTCSDFATESLDYCSSSKTYMVSHRAGGYYFVPGVKNEEDPTKSGTELDIRKEIYRWGPCTSGMMIYEDFASWDGIGIYEYDKKSEKIGGHAIVLMGWGEENGKKYWIVRNSWGEEWGVDGYFKVLRGVNHCEIEENCFVGIPNIPGLRLHLEHPLLYQIEDYVSKYLYNIHDSGYKNSTYEQMALGKVKNIEKLVELYDINAFPDFSKFFAYKVKSKENKESYNYREKDLNILSIGIHNIINYQDRHNEKIKIFKYIIIFILIIILILV